MKEGSESGVIVLGTVHLIDTRNEPYRFEMPQPFSPEFTKEFYRLLEARRSIRKFKPDPIAREQIERLLAGAMQAPSGKNFQNWKFFVLTGPKRDEYVKVQQKSWLAIQPILEKQLKPSLYAFTERFFYTLGEAPECGGR